jgi:hypothetical protein
MNAPTESASWFEAVARTIVIVSFLTVGFCVASLRSHIDEEKIRKEASISSLFRVSIPPEHVLTPAGKRRVKIAKIAIGVLAVTVAIFILRNISIGK